MQSNNKSISCERTHARKLIYKSYRPDIAVYLVKDQAREDCAKREDEEQMPKHVVSHSSAKWRCNRFSEVISKGPSPRPSAFHSM